MRKEVIAVNLGGTNLRVALVRNYKIIKYLKKKHSKEKNKLLRELFDSIESLMTKKVKGIGVACAGPLENGVIKNPPNLPFRNFNLKKILEKRFRKKTEVENDVNCLALAETKFGCRKKNFIVLTLGTGIGGGIIINGKLYKGQGYAGELGHIIIDKGKHFEELWKINKQLTKKIFKREVLIKDLIKMKSNKSRKILNQITLYLGESIASLIDIFDPEIVILAGGVKEAGQEFFNMVTKQVKKYTFIPRTPKIQWTKLKYPELLGAALLIK